MKKLLNTILIAGVLSACNNDDNGGGTPPPSPPPDPLDPLRRISFSYDGSVENGDSQVLSFYTISADGRYISFSSAASNLIGEDSDNLEDVFVYDALNNSLTLQSINDLQIKGDVDSFSWMLNDDGSELVLNSKASNLFSDPVPANIFQVYLRNVLDGTIQLLSQTNSNQAGNGHSRDAVMSSNGRYVALASEATNLVPGDTVDNIEDIYLLDRDSGEFEKLSIPISGGSADDFSAGPGINSDGRYVVFVSQSNNLVQGDDNSFMDVFLYDIQTQTLKRISEGNGKAGGYAPIITSDGGYVLFWGVNDLVAGDPISGGVRSYLYDITSNQADLRLVSLTSMGEPVLNVESHAISGDGRYVAFASANNGIVQGDNNGTTDVFIRDTVNGQTVAVELGDIGVDNLGFAMSMSEDGRYIVFDTSSALTDDDTNGVKDVYRAPNPFLEP